jgi:hypothetical protein
MDTTLEMVIERVKRDASLGTRGPVYTLELQHVQGATTVHVNEAIEHAGPGSVLSMGTSSYYVSSVDVVAKTFTVIPGYMGTEDETHDPPMVVYIDDMHPGGALKDHAFQEILSWRQKLWRTRTKTIAADRTHRSYDFDVGTDVVKHLLVARRAPAGVGWLNFRWNDDHWPRVGVRLDRNADPTTFPSGMALQFRSQPPAGDIRVAYAAEFDLDPFTMATDLVADVGLEEAWIEILELGMRARALSGSISSRADWRAGGHKAQVEGTTLLDVVRSASQVQAARDQALADAANKLRGDWPFGSA